MQNYSTHSFLKQDISRFAAPLFFAAMLAVLAGCGGGSDTATPPPAAAPTVPTTPVATAATIQLLVSSPQMPSSGAKTVDLTAVVLSATKQIVAGRTVMFTIPPLPETAFTVPVTVGGVSDANGVVAATLNLGANKTNRTISIVATADAATATTSVDVTGTTLSISGTSSLAFGNTTTLTFSVKDSAGTALPGVTVSVASQTGNTIVLTPVTGITNASGTITAAVTATKAGNDVITASAAGAGATQTLTVSSASFAFAPLAVTDIPLNTAQAVSVNWKDNGVAQVNKAVSFATTRGAVAGSPAATNAAGDTTGVTVSSATAGPAIITASGPGGTPAASLSVTFVATSASSVTVQAVPSTVLVTSGSASQTNNSSTISALVRDAANNLVKNANVSFTVTADPSGGSLTSATAITDASGSASVTYVAGSTSSGGSGGATGVIISATVNAIGGVNIAPITNNTTLSVAGQALQVRLGTDNKVGGTAPLNQKTYAAIVTDAQQNPSVGTTVRFALRPGRYAKGQWLQGASTWFQIFSTPSPFCANEDTNFNGNLDPGEDLNGSKALEPGGVASVTASGVTDASGVATAVITYPKNYSFWAEVTLEARAGVVGNDPPTTQTFFLDGPSSDYSDLKVSPPGQLSPFGVGASCFDTL